MKGVEIKVFPCGCQLAWDNTGPRAVHIHNLCSALPAPLLTARSWDGKMREFMAAHKGYIRQGRWVWRR